MALRSWTVEDLANHAGISIGSAFRVVAGVVVRPDTIEAVAKAIIDNPPESAIAAFLDEGVA